MDQKQFYKDFFITLAIAGALSMLMLQWPPLSAYLDFAVIGFLFFTGLTWGVYILGEMLTKMPNKMLFSYFSMFIILFKLVAAIAIVFLYQKIIEPENKYFVLIFIVMYFVFTIFEMKVLTALAKKKV